MAAFTSIDRALRPAGRLVLMVWQACDRNGFACTREAFNRLDAADT